jgi:pyruvate,orthophosphate dikinase
MAERFVFGFSEGAGTRDPEALLGGKGAGLAAMSASGLPVPPGFTVTTAACRKYLEGGELPEGLMDEVAEHLASLEASVGKGLGDHRFPLLVAVRSGAPISMPGMMDTVLNLGLNDGTARGLARQTGDARFAYDSYRRFVQMFACVVFGVEPGAFEEALRALKEERGVEQDTELTAEDLRELVETYKGIVGLRADRAFPEDPAEQLELAVRAVFASWRSRRAVVYRREFGVPDGLGTAVTVQAMVFGNLGGSSGTGVAFTRSPATGERGLFGEFLLNAQGEDVVAGVRTPRPIAEMEGALPGAFAELNVVAQRLEQSCRDMQDVEFTVERGKLYLLQTRSGKRTAEASVRIAREMAEEGLLSREEAVLRVEPEQVARLLHPRLDPDAEIEVLCEGLGASPGAATGAIVLDADEAERRGESGEDVILVRRETSPDDVPGLMRAQGVLTATGGVTSHAAVVARGLGKPAVTGCKGLDIDPERGLVRLGTKTFVAGDTITIEGSLGAVIGGPVPLVEPEANEHLEELLRWSDEFRAMRVRANADTPQDARRARELGAEGIGLCRTEHMFMEDGRLEIVRRMIFAEDEVTSEEALSKLELLQQDDFESIFRAMDGLPVTVRLLDPPLHEFLPSHRELREELSASERADGASRRFAELRHRLRVVENLEEKNPMLGLRGVRLGLTRPDVYRTQMRAIARAAQNVRREGVEPVVEVMIPLVSLPAELEEARREAEAVLAEVLGDGHGVKVGTMVELPRACVAAGEIALHADFFSFGTNDLTQTTLGFSRDDAEERFLPFYLREGLLEENPFETLDREGVGRLVSIACRAGRAADPALKLGVCGEHGGDPKSIAFFHEADLDYVSCSPYRVPVARIAAGQAALKNGDAVAARAL